MAAMLRPLGFKLSATKCLPFRYCSSFVSRTRSSNSLIDLKCWLIDVFIDWWFIQVPEPAEGGRRGLSRSAAERSHLPVPPFVSSAAAHTERNPQTCSPHHLRYGVAGAELKHTSTKVENQRSRTTGGEVQITEQEPQLEPEILKAQNLRKFSDKNVVEPQVENHNLR